MAWTPIGDDEFTGDVPLDALTTALERIAAAYQDRFGRLPRLREVLHALRTVVCANPNDYLSDPERAEGAWQPEVTVTTSARASTQALSTGDFQGAWAEEPHPEGTYWVERRPSGPEVIKCQIGQRGRTLEIVYERLDHSLSNDDVESLIIAAILRGFAMNHYAQLVDQIAFIDDADPTRKQRLVPYPGQVTISG